jgi:hypothetical protein
VTRDRLRPAFDASLGALHLNGRWFAVDNDSIFMGTDIANVSRIEGGWPLVRTWLSLVGLSGGSAITSDPWYQEGFRDYRRNLESADAPRARGGGGPGSVPGPGVDPVDPARGEAVGPG